MTEDVILLREVEARRVLGDRAVHLQMLVPYGTWFGYGALRVLRMKINDDRSAELIVGYESYRK